MASRPGGLFLGQWIFCAFMSLVGGAFVEPAPSFSLRSLAEAETRLPCHFRAESDQVVVQVTWSKHLPNGDREQIITAHRSEGQKAFGQWFSRVRFGSSEPTVESSIIIMNTELSDEGRYSCKVNVFPSGNVERQLSLTVWTTPISSLDPLVLVEGRPFGLAASCRSVARPQPRLSWDTELTGQSTNRTLEGGSVSAHFSLYPLRSMNGRRLDCLVWHPTLERPRRLRNDLVVHYPPNVEVSGFDGNWYAGLEGATLRCGSGGNPRPQSFTWTRRGGVLPEGVIPGNGSLLFGRPLSLMDAGVYQCTTRNVVGLGSAEIEVTVSESLPKKAAFDGLLMILVGGAAAALFVVMVVIVVVVSCHHKRKNKKLKQELSVKKEEINTLSRQASFRRINSVSTDARGQTEENIPLRVEGTLRTSLSSLGEQARCRDSPSTLSGGRCGGGGGGGGALDSLGRPVLYPSRKGRERALEREEDSRFRRTESYVRNSTISLQAHHHPALQPTPFPMVPSNELLRSLNGGAITPAEAGSREGGAGWSQQQHAPLSRAYPPVTDEEEEEEEEEEGGRGGAGGEGVPLARRSPMSQGAADDRYSETNSSLTSDAAPNHIPRSNGALKSMPAVGYGQHAAAALKAQIV